MSQAQAHAHHVFGLAGTPGPGAASFAFLDEQTLVFAAANQLVRASAGAGAELRTQALTPGPERGGVVAWGAAASGTARVQAAGRAFALSPNRRFLALGSARIAAAPVPADGGGGAADRAMPASVAVYDLQAEPVRRRKVLNLGDAQLQQAAGPPGAPGGPGGAGGVPTGNVTVLTGPPPQDVISLGFSTDSRWLLVQAGAPDWLLTLWLWEKGRLMAATRSAPLGGGPVHQVSLSPQDAGLACVTGQGVFRLFRYAEGALRGMGAGAARAAIDPHAPVYLSHAWLGPDRVIVGTDTGRLLTFLGGEQRGETIVESPVGSGFPVWAMCTFARGVACSAGPGTVCILEPGEARGDPLHLARTLQIPADADAGDEDRAEAPGITSLVFSPSEETLLVSTDQHRLYGVTLSASDITRGEVSWLEPVSPPPHHGAITGLDVCARKPLAATCSLDRSLRVWNYETNSLELHHVFPEEAHSVALHPSGLQVLVGFSDKLRLLTLLLHDVRPLRDFPVRACKECCFSNGGHLFAAANGNVVQVFSSITFENVANLKGHSGKVRGLAWSVDDARLVSCGLDGAVYEWSPLSGRRDAECVVKACAYTGVAVAPDARAAVYAVGSDRTLKEIADSQVVREVESDGVPLTAVLVPRSGRLLLAGTALGTLRSLRFPLTSTPGDWVEYQGHAGPITKMRVTHDEQFVVTVGEDACVLVWRLTDKEGRSLRRERDVPYSDEILVTKADLQDKEQATLDLRARLEEVRSESEYSQRLRDMTYQEKVRELTDKFVHEMEALKTKNQVLKVERERDAARHTQELTELAQKHAQQLHDTESGNSQKLLLEYERQQELQVRAQRMQDEFEQQLQEADEARERALRSAAQSYEQQLAEQQELLKQVEEARHMERRSHEESRRQLEEDADRELLLSRTDLEKQLYALRDANARLQGEAGIMRKKFASLQREAEERQSEVERVRAEQTRLGGVVRALERDVQALRKEVQERDDTIHDKEKRIHELKKKNQELEKFRFVLDYKIKELKRQMEPREQALSMARTHTQQMETELERFQKQVSQLELAVADTRSKMQAAERQTARERDRVREVEALVKRFKTDLHAIAGLIQEPRQLKEAVTQLYHRYVQLADAKEIRGEDADVQREFARQKDHLERSVASLRKQLSSDTDSHRTENARIIQENVTLIREVSDLRKELRNIRTYVHQLELTAKRNRPRPESSMEIGKGQGAEPSTDHVIELQRMEIRRLREQLHQRPPSGSRLPAITA
ncbi:cilia- and flagella-associated protein 57 [Petromyzon marinus]|uniref:cilia- and flagella-associated protein 57 n=1 Tax=Petromyzon marinus TaxID=7757 RepID=UPI003F706DE6